MSFENGAVTRGYDSADRQINTLSVIVAFETAISQLPSGRFPPPVHLTRSQFSFPFDPFLFLIGASSLAPQGGRSFHIITGFERVADD